MGRNKLLEVVDLLKFPSLMEFRPQMGNCSFKVKSAVTKTTFFWYNVVTIDFEQVYTH